MTFENILVEENRGIATITINRPTKLNALNRVTIEELHNAFKGLKNNRNIKVIIITGSERKPL